MVKAIRLLTLLALLASMAMTAGAGIKWDNLIRIIAPIVPIDG